MSYLDHKSLPNGNSCKMKEILAEIVWKSKAIQEEFLLKM